MNLPDKGWTGYGRPGIPAPEFLERIKDTSADYAQLSTFLDLLETKAANVSGITAWEPDTALAYESAVIPHRR